MFYLFGLCFILHVSNLGPLLIPYSSWFQLWPTCSTPGLSPLTSQSLSSFVQSRLLSAGCYPGSLSHETPLSLAAFLNPEVLQLGMGGHGWVAVTSGHRSVTWSRGWLAGLQWKPLGIHVSQASNLHLGMQLLNAVKCSLTK